MQKSRRAILLIGVSKTGGGLVPLQAVESGLDEMEAWAVAQGIARDDICRISDEGGTKKVILRELIDWITSKNNDLQVPQQLIVYFSGHGFHGRGGDVWLLSDAPTYPSEAVSLFGSEAGARNSSFEHVIFISDACRIPSENLQFAYVLGNSIFPNLPPAGQSKPVDQFFASVAGEPALEINDAGKPCSIYTRQLAHALSGLDPGLLEPENLKSPTPMVIRAWPLKRFLPDVIRRRLEELNVQHSMVPDAIIASAPEMWLARFTSTPNLPSSSPLAHVSYSPARPEEQNQTELQKGTVKWFNDAKGHGFIARQNGEDVFVHHSAINSNGFRGLQEGQAVDFKIVMGPKGWQASNVEVVERVFAPLDPAQPSDQFQQNLALALARSAYTLKLAEGAGAHLSKLRGRKRTRDSSASPISWHFETGCGFSLSGGEAIVATGSGNLQIDLPSPTEVRVDIGKHPSPVLLQFAGGLGLLLPAIPGQIGYVRLNENGSPRSVAYEPSSNGPQWSNFENTSNPIRQLRDFLNKMADEGNLRFATLNDEKLDEVVAVLKYGQEDIDFSLLVMLSYVGYSSRSKEVLQQLRDLALKRFNFIPMDLAILSVLSDEGFRLDDQPVLPFFPLLAQGWPLMNIAGIPLPPALVEAQNHIHPSSWTTWDEQGVGMIAAYLRGDYSHELKSSQQTATSSMTRTGESS